MLHNKEYFKLIFWYIMSEKLVSFFGLYFRQFIRQYNCVLKAFSCISYVLHHLYYVRVIITTNRKKMYFIRKWITKIFLFVRLMLSCCFSEETVTTEYIYLYRCIQKTCQQPTKITQCIWAYKEFIIWLCEFFFPCCLL